MGLFWRLLFYDRYLSDFNKDVFKPLEDKRPVSKFYGDTVIKYSDDLSRDAIAIITYESEKASPEESESEQSVEDVTEYVGKLKIDDEKFLSPDSASTASAHSSDESTPVSANVPREKLNEFL